MSSAAFFIAAGWGALVLVSVTAAEGMARTRRREAEAWMLLAAMMGPLALLALKLLGDAPPSTAAEKAKQARIGGAVAMVIAIGFALVMLIPFGKACFRL